LPYSTSYKVQQEGLVNLNLLRVNKQVHCEAASVFAQSNFFWIRTRWYDTTSAPIDFIRDTGAYMATMIRALQIDQFREVLNFQYEHPSHDRHCRDI
jgi:hypothetical protein